MKRKPATRYATHPPSAKQVREPVQLYVSGDERRLLDRMAIESGLSRAEVLRRGLKLFAREQPAENNPMVAFMREMRGSDWPADIGRRHDAHLEEAILDTHEDAAPPPARRKKR
jgi:hypothetical protein